MTTGAESGFQIEKRLLNWSLGISVVLLVIKVVAAAVTDSAAIYGDAAESIVHVLAVIFASYSLRLSRKPADETHHFGHDKVSFLASGFEGAMISVAAMLIFYQAGRSWWVGMEVRSIDFGLWLTLGVGAVNAALGIALVRAGKRQDSLILRANGLHVLTDVWTSVGVVAGLILVKATGLGWWDPLVAIILAGNILHTGWKLIRQGLGGLMDEVDPALEAKLRAVFDAETKKRKITYHHLRCRSSGRRHWVEVHLVFADDVTVKRAHDLATEIEATAAEALGTRGRVISHLEPRSEEGTDEKWEI